MKVIRQSENIRCFKDVAIGDCIYCEGEYYLVINPTVDEYGEKMNAVCVDGFIRTFYDDEVVEVLNAKIVVE